MLMRSHRVPGKLRYNQIYRLGVCFTETLTFFDIADPTFPWIVDFYTLVEVAVVYRQMQTQTRP